MLAAAGVIWSAAGLVHGTGKHYQKIETQQGGQAAAVPESASDREKQPPETETVPQTEPETAEVTTAEPETVGLLFGGDVYLSDHVLNAYQKAGGIDGVLDPGFREKIADADLFMVNEEFPFSSRGTAAADKTYTFRLPPEKVSMFHEMGIDIVTLANNHVLDFGREALEDTCATLEEAGIPYVGAGKDLDRAKQLEILEVHGKKIGFLGASRVIPEASWAASESRSGLLTTYDPAILLKEIEAARPQCDYLVVYVHWGIERNDKPETYQKNMGRQYIDAGADLVIGAHPHVLQGIEYYNGKPIVYSLGNFVFGSSIPKTMLLEAEVSEDGTKLTLIPGTSSAGYTRMLEDAGSREAFYRYLESISFGISIDGDGVVSAAQ